MGNGAWILPHAGEQFPEWLTHEGIDEDVVPQDVLREVDIAPDRAVEAFLDAFRQIADALEFGRDFHRRGDQTEIPRRRLLEGQEPDTILVDLHIEGVDPMVPLDHVIGNRGVPSGQSLQDILDLPLGQPNHFQQRHQNHARCSGIVHKILPRLNRAGPADLDNEPLADEALNSNSVAYRAIGTVVPRSAGETAVPAHRLRPTECGIDITRSLCDC